VVAVAVVATSVGVTCTGARRFMLFRASDTCLATMSEIVRKADADKSGSSRLSCMFASAAGKSSGTVPPFNSIAIVSSKGSTVARSLVGEASITLLVRRSEYFKKRPFFGGRPVLILAGRGALWVRGSSRPMTETVPELVSEAPLHTQRAVCFSCWKIFEVKQSSVKKERVFHTQECKMLHSHSAEIFKPRHEAYDYMFSLSLSLSLNIYHRNPADHAGLDKALMGENLK